MLDTSANGRGSRWTDMQVLDLAVLPAVFLQGRSVIRGFTVVAAASVAWRVVVLMAVLVMTVVSTGLTLEGILVEPIAIPCLIAQSLS